MADRSDFSELQYADAYPDGIEDSYWNLARNAVIAGAVGASTGVVLDVGCGRGIVVDDLRRRGIDCWGCESAWPRPINQWIAPFLFLGRSAQSLDADLARRVRTVLLLDVIEHLEHPEQLLVACRTSFPAAERFVITVPARAELWTNFDDHFGHHRRYDRRMLQDAVACLSPARVDIRYFFHVLYPAIRLSKLVRGAREVSVSAPASRWSRLAHRVVAAGLRGDSRLLPRWLPGSSLLCTVEL